MSESRIYEVQVKGSPVVRLVDAVSAAQALRHVAKQQFEVTLPTTKRVAYLMGKGIVPEDATRLPADPIEANQAGIRG
jgi:hypothetical protein